MHNTRTAFRLEKAGRRPRRLRYGHQSFSGDPRLLDGVAGEAASHSSSLAEIEDGIESTRNMAREIDGDELINGRVELSIDGTGGDYSFRTNGARRKKQKNPNNSSRARGVGNGRSSVPAVLLLLVASFTSNLVVTAEENGRHAAHEDEKDAGGPFERILQEEQVPNGLFDYFNQISGSNEAESEGSAERQTNGGGVEEAWLQFVANGPNDESQPALIDSCKHQLFIDLVYDVYPEDTKYELAKVGSNLTFSHTGVSSGEYAQSYHAYDQIVCMDDGDYNFTIWSEFRSLVQLNAHVGGTNFPLRQWLLNLGPASTGNTS